MYVKPSEKAQKLDPQVATLLNLVQQAMSPVVADTERTKLSDEVYTLLEGLLPTPAEPKMEAGQLQIWAQIQNLHKTMDQAAALLEQYQKEIPEMQSQLSEQTSMEARMDELSTAVDMLSTKVTQVEDKTKVSLPSDGRVVNAVTSGCSQNCVLETIVRYLGGKQNHGTSVATGGLHR